MASGNEYIPTFPPLVLETISKSNVFLYAFILPKIPFKPTVNSAASKAIIKPENELIALGLEQFIPFLREDPHHVGKNGNVPLIHVCSYIQRYIMPIRDYHKIYKHIYACKHPRAEPNPIQNYFQNDKAPVFIHYVFDMVHLGNLPPNQRKSDELPYQWKMYIYPNLLQPQAPTNVLIPILPNNTKRIAYPMLKSFVAKRRRILPKPSNSAKSITRVTSAVKRRIKFENVSISSFKEFKNNSKAASTPINTCRKLERYFKSPQSTNKTKFSNLFKLKFNSRIFNNLLLNKVPLNNDKMLPSMPSLSVLNKESPERTASPQNEEPLPLLSNTENNSAGYEQNKIEVGISEETIEKDNIDDINALMVASSTSKPVRKKSLSGPEKKKAKLKKDLCRALTILADDDEEQSDEKTNRYVQAFYDKLQERLDIHEYHSLIEILNNFEESRDSVVDLYKSVTDILSPKYSDLTDEFLSFLTSSQAKAVGKFVPHIMINNMSLFLQKLEMYFKGQPFQVKKIYRSITELADCVDVTMDRVKSTILPLLKGNKLLIDWFLQIFPCEKPTQSSLNGTWETVEIGKDNMANTKDEVYETVIVPETEDPYGGPNCICSCHNVEDQAFKTRSRHCIPCGTKFLQGRVYVHTGKGLRLAKISFDSDSNINHHKRLACQSSIQPKRRPENNSSKHLSPLKDIQDDVRMSNESEDDDCVKKKLQKLSKTPRKRRPKPKREKKTFEKQKITFTNDNKSEIAKYENVDSAEKKFDAAEHVQENDSSLNEKKSASEEVIEWDCNTSIESVELKLSPEHSAESESGETSQDNINTDSDCSTENVNSPAHLHSENSNSNPGDEVSSWTREEDKIILETFRREGDKEATYQQIAKLLENRSAESVKSRFQTLLNILQKMAAKKVL